MAAAIRSGRASEVLITAGLFVAALTAGVLATYPAEASAHIMSLPKVQPLTGDFDAMLKRRTVRILVVPNKTLFFIDKGNATGAVAELGLELEKWLTERYGKKPFRINVVFV